MDILVPKYRRNPNERVESLYFGVAQGNRTVTTLVKPSLDRNRLEASRAYGPMLPRGSGGQVAVLVLGGMETTLAEMEYILEAKRQKRFVPRRSNHEIADMCRLLTERRNDQIRYLRKNPSEAPKRRPVRLLLPRGYRFVRTSEPGLRVRVRV